MISLETDVKAHIFIPKIDGPDRKLPVFVHYHGGGGESAGANIAHFVLFRAGSTIMGLAGLKIEDLDMVHPFFGANKEPDKIIEMYKFMGLSSTEFDDDRNSTQKWMWN
ncbi:hypothetical protein QYF36_020386 [Acer negundo]|nr:hypothetical protein QYF36_020386 [Acer negundo]